MSQVVLLLVLLLLFTDETGLETLVQWLGTDAHLLFAEHQADLEAGTEWVTLRCGSKTLAMRKTNEEYQATLQPVSLLTVRRFPASA